MVEFTCLSCTRTFSISIEDLSKTDYLACIGCQKPIPNDLLAALQIVSSCFIIDNPKNTFQWHIRCHPEGEK